MSKIAFGEEITTALVGETALTWGETLFLDSLGELALPILLAQNQINNFLSFSTIFSEIFSNISLFSCISPSFKINFT